MPFSIMLADHRSDALQELRGLLNAAPDLSICGESYNALETVEMVELLQPDILVLHVGIPNLDGLGTVHRLRNLSVRTQLILLSAKAEESWVQEALRSGAAAYIMKDSCLQELVRAIHVVAAGHRFLGTPFYDLALETYIRTRRFFSPNPSQMLDFEFRNYYH